jgi:hypothetical protein
MPTPGDRPLFTGRSVADFRAEVLADIRERAAHLDEDSTEDIPQAMFLAGVLPRYDFSLPTLHFDRAFSRDVTIDGDRYLEIHVPMVGAPRNLHFSPPRTDTGERLAAALEYEVVDGDLCLYLALDRSHPAAVDVGTDELLGIAAERYEVVRDELQALRTAARETAVKRYRRETGADQEERFVL